MNATSEIMLVQKFIKIGSKVVEILLAFSVLVGTLIVSYNTFVTGNAMGKLLSGEIGFLYYMEMVFSIAIGIEFVEMLCRPDATNVLEILIFIMARHMIVERGTIVDSFLTVIAICIMCCVRRFLRVNKFRMKKEGFNGDEI